MKKALRGIALALIALVALEGCRMTSTVEIDTNTQITIYDDKTSDSIFYPAHWRCTPDGFYQSVDGDKECKIARGWKLKAQPKRGRVVLKHKKPYQVNIYTNLPENNMTTAEWYAKWEAEHPTETDD